MFTFSADGTHLIFRDGFGLTRLTFPNKLKTERSLTGERGPLSMNAAATRLLACDPRHYRVLLRRLPGLEPDLHVFEISDQVVALSPDGAYLAHVQEGDEPRLLLSTSDKKDRKGHPLGGGQVLPALKLGPAGPRDEAPVAQLVVALDGSYAYLSRQGQLYLGKVGPRRRATPAYQLALKNSPARLRLYPSASGTWLVRHSGAQGKAYLALVAPDGEVTQREVACPHEPLLEEGCLSFQSALDEVLQVPLDGRPTRRFPLGADAGPGMLMAGPGRLCFLPWHAEKVLDLEAGTALPRKLASAEAKVRLAVLTALRSLRQVAARTELRVGLEELRVRPGRYSVSYWLEGGAGTLLERLVEGVARDFGNLPQASIPGYRISSFGTVGGGGPLRRVTLEDVRQVFQACDAHGLPLLALLSALEHDYNQAGGYGGGLDRHGSRYRPLMDPEAEALLLWGLLETVAARKAIPLLPRVEEWLRTPLSTDEVLARIATLGKKQWQEPFGLVALLARPLVHHFGEDCLPLLRALLVEHPDGFTQANLWQVTQVALPALDRHPGLRESLQQDCQAALVQARGQRRKYLETLAQTLAS